MKNTVLKKRMSVVIIIITILQLFTASTTAENAQSDLLLEESAVLAEGNSYLYDSEPNETLKNITSEEPTDDANLNIGQSELAAAASNWTWSTANKATTIVSSPYDGINTTIASINSGDGFYIIERDYAYFYVQRTVNGKFQQGYIKVTDVNYTSYNWVSHNIFQRGITNFTASSQEVLSGPGTSNSYEHIGTIYQNESPLLLLRTEVNTYNNVTYCLIQYKVTGVEQFKRGWVPYSAVSVFGSASSTEYIDEDKIFYFESAATNKMIQAAGITSGSYVNQQSANISSNSQMFKIEVSSPGYYRFILQSNTDISLQVLGNLMQEGARLGVGPKGNTGAPNKAEEFEVTVTSDGEFYLKSRCTGLYRCVDLYGGLGANGTSIISSQSVYATNQRWRFQPKILQGNDISIIKVGDSTGRACVSMYNTFSNRNVYYANPTNLLSTTNVSENINFRLPHIQFAIKNSSVFYINGHGDGTNYIWGQNRTPKYYIKPSEIGFSTNDRTRWGVLSPCNQLNNPGSAVEWAQYALRNGVRGILGYHYLAPPDDGGANEPQPANIHAFTTYINSNYTFPNAWFLANSTSLTTREANWALIYHASAAQDTKSNYNVQISNPSSSLIYYASREETAGPLSTSSPMNINQFVQKNTSGLSARTASSGLAQSGKMVKQDDGTLLFENKTSNVLKSDGLKYNKDKVTSIIADFMTEQGLLYDKSAAFEWGEIKRSVLSDDQTRFENEETLAYTVSIIPVDSEDGKGLYFEVTNDGVTRCHSAI